MKKKPLILLILVSLLLWTMACDYQTPSVPASEVPVPTPPGPSGPEPADDTPYAIVVENANELGRVPILMYHRIAPQEADWTRSIDNFREDLKRLYELGYTLVNLGDFYDGRVVVPPGRSPVVLTFDDSTRAQFNYLVDDKGEVSIDPDCAVGMILEAAEKWPELGTAGTFYVNAFPFGQRQFWQQKLQHLVELGFEIGNHTYSHPKLSQLTPRQVQEEIARLHSQIQEAVPDYTVRSIALPYGLAPGERVLAVKGQWGDVAYDYSYILEVGAGPAFAPIHMNHNPLSMPRITAADEHLNRWLSWLEQPLNKYISDGNPDQLTVPDELSGQIIKAP